MFYKFCSELIPTDLRSKGYFQLEIYIQIIVKLFDNMCSFGAQISDSFSLLYLSRLIVEKWIYLETKIHTPPWLYVCLQKVAPKVNWLKFILLISSALKWCSVKQLTWGALGGTEFKSSSIFFLDIPHMFCWSVENILILQWSFEELLKEWIWFLLIVIYFSLIHLGVLWEINLLTLLEFFTAV